MNKFFIIISIFLSLNSHAWGVKVEESVAKYRPFRIQQLQGENNCWALAAIGVMGTFRMKLPRPCEAVSKVKGMQCCGGQYSLTERCNVGGRAERVFDAYGLSYISSGVDFNRAFQALKSGALLAISIDVSNSSFGSRAGHAAFIYGAQRYSDGSYEFYVSDSANGFYTFNTKALKKLKNEYKYSYLSLNLSFIWEDMAIVYKK